MRSARRVTDYGEVFTPEWMVEDMLDLVETESDRIESRFLEPACGSGNFLVSILRRKLTSVQNRYGKSDFDKKHYALLSLMSIYGIELLDDNVNECRNNLLNCFVDYLELYPKDHWCHAALNVLNVNILQGDALTMTMTNGDPIVFPEWGYLGNGKFQRRDFLFNNLTERSLIEGSLFEMLEDDEIFVPSKVYQPMTAPEIN